MVTFQDDTLILPTLERLAGCLCAEIDPANSGFAGTCFCGLIPGDVMPLDLLGDNCKECGVAWVRMVRAYPTTSFPEQAGYAKCWSGMAFEVEVGIARCFPMPQRKQIPGPDALYGKLREYMADMSAMRRAIQCCFADDDSIDHTLVAYEVIPVSGGISGGVWRLIVSEPL